MSIELHNGDCMEALRAMPDNAFELAIVDPPYGIGDRLTKGGRGGSFDSLVLSGAEKWDVVPDSEYFTELERVSVNQIIWGGNYFDLPPTRGIICWDKKQPFDNFSAWEMAWTSTDKPASIFRYDNKGFMCKDGAKIHPTQKPVALYKWLLANYANEGDRILDTHLGSGSIAIACHDARFDLVGYELDKDYYEAACARLQKHQAQGQFSF